MDSKFFTIILSLVFCLSANAQAVSNSSYVMDIILDVENKKLTGKTTLDWTNTSEDDITEMYFHLYYNGFKNSESTFFKDDGGIPDFLSKDIDEVCGWGWSKINTIISENGKDLLPSLTFEQPDDSNSDDRTVFKIILDQPLAPGESVTLDIGWEAKIPKTMPRTGYNKDFYFFAQWFPKVGVYESKGIRGADKGKWNCHQYHGSGEYYADFSDYTVSMTVPKDYVVASSGQQLEHTIDEQVARWKFQVNDVIDFTWAASPHFELVEDTYKDISIKHYSYPYKSHVAPRYFNTLKFAMEFLEEHLGPYPYPTLTILDPPIHGLFTGGMEYPTLITSISFNFFPEGFRTPETLATHEYVHQYFMQMVASHEVEEPWLDEGFTTYWEARILDSLFNNNSMICLSGVKVGTRAYNRHEFLNSEHPYIASNDLKSYEYIDGGYGTIAYNKTALWLQTLEGLIGQEVMDRIWKTYFLRWKFKHPCGRDFVDIVNEVVMETLSTEYPSGMDWFFEQTLYGTARCDYAVGSITELEPREIRGFFEDYDACEVLDSENSGKKTRIELHRYGDMQLPVEIEVNYSDGSKSHSTWNGKGRSYSFVTQDTTSVLSVVIDPENKLYIDENVLNNSMLMEADRTSYKQVSGSMHHLFSQLIESLSLLF